MGRVTSGPEDWLHTHNLNPVDKNIIITNWSDIYSSADLQLLEDVWIHRAWHHVDHWPGIIQTVSSPSVLLPPNVLYLLFPSLLTSDHCHLVSTHQIGLTLTRCRLAHCAHGVPGVLFVYMKCSHIGPSLQSLISSLLSWHRDKVRTVVSTEHCH